MDSSGDTHILSGDTPTWSNNELYNISLEYLRETTPTGYSLLQNYPNPFNLSTTISFAIPNKSHVNISVFDINGRLVATLLSESLDSGYHSVNWNGVDANGLNVSAGLYVYILQADDVKLSSKMILMK